MPTLPSEPPLPTGPGEPRIVARDLARFGSVVAVAWIILFALWKALPGVQHGAAQIYASAIDAIESERLYPDDATVKLVIFGTSQVQAGFVPDRLDELSEGIVSSYNLGLPDTLAFLNELETLVERGHAPTHVLLTVGWYDAPHDTTWNRFWDDDRIMDALFPFRDLPRDLALFLLRAPAHGGPAAFYGHSIASVREARAGRGYFFLEMMSHFPGHRLPDDFGLETDDPRRIWKRPSRAEGRSFEQLQDLIERGGFQVLLVPVYGRFAEFGEPPPLSPNAEALEAAGIRVLGPDYWRLPNRLFSDPAHLNRQGARCYTEKLWNLLAPELKELGARSQPATSCD